MIQYAGKEVKIFFMSHFGVYIIYTLLITGAIASTYRIEQYLYIINYIIILMVLPKLSPAFELKGIIPSKWGVNFILIILLLGILAFIAINVHGELSGAHNRFEF